MRVAVLTTSYPLTPQSSSGIFVARLIDKLPSAVEMTVITPASRTIAGTQIAGRATIQTFRYAPRQLQILAHEPGGIPVALQAHPWTQLLLPGFLLAMFIACVRNARKAEIVHANWAICGCVAGLVRCMTRVPVVTTLRGADITRAERKWLDRLILTLCIKLSTRIVCVSNAIENWLREQYPRQAAKICIIENGVEEELLALSPDRPASGPNNELRLLTVGSLIPRKGIERAIRALRGINRQGRAVLTIVGDGPERARLAALANELGLSDKVEFRGALAPTDVMHLLATTDVFILSSTSEGRPNVVLEAMAAAVPVVASDIPGTQELVEHGHTGYLFTPDNIDMLVQHLRSLQQSPELRTKMGLAGRAAILRRQLRWNETAARYYELYRQAIEDRS